MTLGEWVRAMLLSAGSRGTTCADLHTLRKQSDELVYRGGTYASFARFFHWYKQLGYIEATGEQESSSVKGGADQLTSPRVYYRITGTGMGASMYQWGDPIATLHPEWDSMTRKYKYAPPSGKQRGRPLKKVV